MQASSIIFFCVLPTESFYKMAHPVAPRSTGGKCPFRAVLQTQSLHSSPLASTSTSPPAPIFSKEECKEVTSSSGGECKCVTDGLRPKGLLEQFYIDVDAFSPFPTHATPIFFTKPLQIIFILACIQQTIFAKWIKKSVHSTKLCYCCRTTKVKLIHPLCRNSYLLQLLICADVSLKLLLACT